MTERDLAGSGRAPRERSSARDLAGLEGIVFDVDDTVTRAGVLEREAFIAMWAAREAGLRTIALTGRPLGWAEVIASIWPVDLAIGENGAGWHWREGRSVRAGHWDAGDPAALERVRARLRAEMPEVREAIDQGLRRRDLALDVGELARLDRDSIARLRSLIEAEGLRCTVSSVHAHAIPGPWDKALGAVRAMREALGVDEERARTRYLFVGDSGNDAAAFAFFEHTAGVANVLEHWDAIAVPPAWIAGEDRGRGFAEIVAAVIAARRG